MGRRVMENTPHATPVRLERTPKADHAAMGFRDLGDISKKLSLLLLTGAGLHLLGIVWPLIQRNLLTYPPCNVTAAHADDSRQLATGAIQTILFLVTTIVFGRWIYLAQRNLPELGARDLRFTPRWAVACFFIPIVNLWDPYQAMRDLAKASRRPPQWQGEDAPSVLIIWWMLWLAQLPAGEVFCAALPPYTFHGLRTKTTVEIVSSALAVPLYLLAHYIVWRVWRDQSKNHLQLGNLSAN